jgi:hypothetical protein
LRFNQLIYLGFQPIEPLIYMIRDAIHFRLGHVVTSNFLTGLVQQDRDPR